MTIYFVIIGISSLFAIFGLNKTNIDKYIYYFFVYFLICVSMFRALSVGTDTSHYYEYFSHLDIEDVRGTEYGWFLINYLCKNIFNSYTLFLGIVATLTFIFISKAIFDNSKNIAFSLFLYIVLYFYFNSFNISRQILAASIFLFATRYILQQNFGKYLFWILISTSIHTSAIITLPFFFIGRIKSFSKLIIISCVLLSLFVPANRLLLYGLDLFEGNELYGLYAQDFLGSRDSISLNLLLHTLIVIVIGLFSKENTVYFLLFFIGVVLANLFGATEVIARIAIYFKFSIILLLPNIHWNFKQRNIGVFCSLIISVLLFIACCTMILANDADIVPYYI